MYQFLSTPLSAFHFWIEDISFCCIEIVFDENCFAGLQMNLPRGLDVTNRLG